MPLIFLFTASELVYGCKFEIFSAANRLSKFNSKIVVIWNYPDDYKQTIQYTVNHRHVSFSKDSESLLKAPPETMN